MTYQMSREQFQAISEEIGLTVSEDGSVGTFKTNTPVPMALIFTYSDTHINVTTSLDSEWSSQLNHRQYAVLDLITMVTFASCLGFVSQFNSTLESEYE